MNGNTIPTKRRSRGVVASYFLIFAFLFVVVVGIVGEVQYSRGFEEGGTQARIKERAMMAHVLDTLPVGCYPDLHDLP